MAVILWLMGVALLAQGSLCSHDNTTMGCKTWRISGDDACCEECHAGHRLVKECGPRPKELCKPCETGTFTLNSKDYRCNRCSQCVGVQVKLESCTIMSDTKCGCKAGHVCGDESCSFCKERCDKGHEPTSDRSCRPCPHGTYNDKSQQMCKPWSTRCPSSDQVMVARGNATSDIQCVLPATRGPRVPVTRPYKPGLSPVFRPGTEDDPDQAFTFLTLIIAMVLMAFLFTIIIIIVVLKFKQKEKKPEKSNSKTPIIRPPTDDPRTLIAVECSFNEAQQEQGSSTESLISKGPAGHLV